LEHPATHRGKNSSSSAARTHVSTYKPRFHKNPENPIHNQSRNFQNHDQRERENKKAANIEREHQQGNQIHPRIWNIKITNIIISKTIPLKFSLHIRHSPLSSSREREREREFPCLDRALTSQVRSFDLRVRSNFSNSKP